MEHRKLENRNDFEEKDLICVLLVWKTFDILIIEYFMITSFISYA